MLELFHPAVRLWFERRFPEGPTPPQEGAWPSIAAGNDTLVAAPTGSGKTLSGFLVGIDQLYKAHERGEDITDRTQPTLLAEIAVPSAYSEKSSNGSLDGISRTTTNRNRHVRPSSANPNALVMISAAPLYLRRICTMRWRSLKNECPSS